MGFTHPSFFPLKIGGNILGRLDITSIAADWTMGSITIPSFNGVVEHAFITMFSTNIHDSAVNELDGDQYIQISNDAGSTWHDAILLNTGTFRNTSAGSHTSANQTVGAIDIKDYVASGGTLTARLHNAKADTGEIYVYNVQLILDIVVRCP